MGDDEMDGEGVLDSRRNSLTECGGTKRGREAGDEGHRIGIMGFSEVICCIVG